MSAGERGSGAIDLELEIFRNLFVSIAEEMDVVLKAHRVLRFESSFFRH